MTILTRRTAGALAVLSLLLSWLFLSAGSAHAVGVSITASTSTGLDPAGQTITVTGKGFNPGIKLFLTVCDPSKGAGRACDVINFKMVDTDSAGGFVAEYKPVAKFGTTDCLATPCALQTSWMGNGKDRTQEATLAVNFTGGVPASLPTAPQPTGGPSGAPSAPATGGGSSAAATGNPGGAVPEASPGAGSADSTAGAAEKSDDSSSTGIVIGVIAAVVVVVGAGTYFFVRRRNAN
ncbi:neocarzinostatin apoprotein domain-containing protein [Yinghuangia soli]|uniref:LPXTG cell wall anchor domain-containing protein n=1 Tax=Yinghuangia soli TaxID=2908204 RepID=A0AA41PVF9_9ACTN|nr:neocarzinostatin apoprotein domain-containing protein [Yinghuangia soli]MCF2526085.1 hypothetical protein [Yinghuangia soli]